MRNRIEILRLAAEIISDLSAGEPRDADVYRFVIRDLDKMRELAAERANEIDEIKRDLTLEDECRIRLVSGGPEW